MNLLRGNFLAPSRKHKISFVTILYPNLVLNGVHIFALTHPLESFTGKPLRQKCDDSLTQNRVS